MSKSTNVTIIISADSYASRELIKQSVNVRGLVYLRCAKSRMPVIYREQEKFTIGKAKLLKDGSEIAIIASGAAVHLAWKAVEKLEKEGISVKLFDMHTVHPIDHEAVQECMGIGKIIIVEDYDIPSGLGSIVGDFVSGQRKGNVTRVGIWSQFLLNQEHEQWYGIAFENIVKTARKMLR